MAPLKVLIVGGGITGPSLAYWLSKLDSDITLIERSPQMRATGQQLDLRGQGVTMMKKLGIEAAVRAKLVREPGMQLVDVKGRTKVFMPACQSGTGKQGITSEFEIMRGDLVEILYALTENKPNVKHLFDTTIQSFTQDDESDPNGKVHVTFRDGSVEDFDMVVAADGTGSKTRRIMLGPEFPDPRRSSGGYIAYFSIPSAPGDSNRFTFCHLPSQGRGRIWATRQDRPDLLRVYMLMTGSDAALDAALKSGDMESLKKALSDLYEDAGWEGSRFLNGLRNAPEANDVYCTPMEEVVLPPGSWSRGRVVLAGDAAHSHTANGYGTTWGMVGTYILAGEIATLLEKGNGTGKSPTEAIVQGAKRYEELWRPVAGAKEGAGMDWAQAFMFPRSTWGIWLLHTVVRCVAFLRLDLLAMSLEKTNSQVPEYPALERAKDRV